MRLIDADVLPKLLDAEYKQTMKLIQEGEKHLDTLAEGFAEASHIAKYIAPTVDAVPVVPCKGCEHAERYERIDGTAGYYCGHPQSTFVYGERWDRVFKPVKEVNGQGSKIYLSDGPIKLEAIEDTDIRIEKCEINF